MAPPNKLSNSVFDSVHVAKTSQFFSLSDGKLSVNDVPLLSDVPGNVSLNSFSSICGSSDAPPPLIHQVQSRSFKGGFLEALRSADELTRQLPNRSFLSIFRFKTWWSTMCVGSSGSELQMETQWLFLDVPESQSYILILPLLEGSFRSALHDQLTKARLNEGSSGHLRHDHLCLLPL